MQQYLTRILRKLKENTGTNENAPSRHREHEFRPERARSLGLRSNCRQKPAVDGFNGNDDEAWLRGHALEDMHWSSCKSGKHRTFVAAYSAWFGMPAMALRLAIDTITASPPVAFAYNNTVRIMTNTTSANSGCSNQNRTVAFKAGIDFWVICDTPRQFTRTILSYFSVSIVE